jgi:hypothetical protein
MSDKLLKCLRVPPISIKFPQTCTHLDSKGLNGSRKNDYIFNHFYVIRCSHIPGLASRPLHRQFCIAIDDRHMISLISMFFVTIQHNYRLPCHNLLSAFDDLQRACINSRLNIIKVWIDRNTRNRKLNIDVEQGLLARSENTFDSLKEKIE